MAKIRVAAHWSYDELLSILRQFHGLEEEFCTLVDTHNEELKKTEFSIERYVRNKRYIGCTRIYIAPMLAVNSEDDNTIELDGRLLVEAEVA